jgi:hypothetical protein
MNMMEDELTRGQLLDILATVGGSGVALDEVDDLMPICLNTISRVTDPARLDRALDQPLTFELRAALRTRRLELDQIAKAAATPRKAPAFLGMVAIVPDRLASMSHFVGMNGVSREVRTIDGKRVLDCSPGEFRQILLTGPFGLDWLDSNPDHVLQASTH